MTDDAEKMRDLVQAIRRAACPVPVVPGLDRAALVERCAEALRLDDASPEAIADLVTVEIDRWLSDAAARASA